MTDAHPPHGTLSHVIGNLAKPSLERILESSYYTVFGSFAFLKVFSFLLPPFFLFCFWLFAIYNFPSNVDTYGENGSEPF